MTQGDERVTGSATITVGTTDDEDDRGAWRWVAAVGVVVLVGALLVGVVPGRYVPEVPVGVGGAVRSAVLAGGAAIGLFGLYSLSGEAPDGDEEVAETPQTEWRDIDDDPVELATRTRSRTTGGSGGIGRELDAELERIGGLVDGTNRSESYRAYKVEQNLRELAVRVLRSETSWSDSEARQRLESGRWTDDPRAAAFLSEETVDLPVGVRLIDWANGEMFRRQVDATVDELAQYMEVETS